MRAILVLRLGLTLGMLAAAEPAFAQAAEPSANSRDDDIVVTASRSGEGVSAGRLGASVTTLDNEALERRQTRIVSDVLRDVPGVAVTRAGAIGGFTQVRVRGTESNHVLVLIDGIEAADPYNGEYDFGTLIADPDARIEVLRGQQSSLYGSDAIGGVIHYMTLSGREAPGVSLRAEAGSFGTLSAAARLGGASDALDYALSASLYRTDGTPTAREGTRDIGSDSLGMTGKVNFTPSAKFRLTGVLRYSFARADSNNTENDPASPLFGLTVDSPGVHFKNAALYGLLSAELTALNERWSNTLTGQFSDTERKGYAPPFPPDTDPFDYGDKGQRYKGSFVSSIRLGGEAFSHRLTGAVDIEREQFRNTSPGTGSPFDAFTGTRHTNNIGLVGQYELDAGAFDAGASLRHDDNDRFDNATTWRVQASYRLPSATRVHAAYGTGVKNPGYYELYGYSDGRYIGNPALRPEKSEGWEAGIEQSFALADVTVGATYFDSILKGEIYTIYPPPDLVATPANRTTQSKQHGVEIYLAARPVPQLRLDAAYTYLHAEENGVEEIHRPGDIASFNATLFSRDERFAGTLTVRYNGEQKDVTFTDPTYATTPIATLDSYVLVNLNLEYKVRPGISLFARAENLFDADYEEVFGFATPGTGLYGGVKARL